MRFIVALVLIVAPAVSAAAQSFVVQGPCAGGQCPPQAAFRGSSGPGSIPSSAGSSPAELHIDDAAIVRVTNSRAGSMSAGTGTLVDAEPNSGLVVTCAHLFREGTGDVSVVFPNRQTFAARVIKTDAGADLAALAIGAPSVAPIELAESFPRPGDPLVSCGYGSDGRLWCNRGQALGYVTAAGGQNLETLELSGAARHGDSGGPVLDRDHHLVAVLFGTNGRVVDGTFCGRVRRFLAGLSPRFGRPRSPVATAPNAAAPVAPYPSAASAPPGVARPAAGTGDAEKEKLARLDELVKRMTQAWQSLAIKVDALVASARQAQQAADAASAAAIANATAGASPDAAGPSTDDSAGAAAPPPITTNVPAPPDADPLETLAEPWLSAKLAAVLVSFGVPGGIAGVAAGAAVWFVMRRGKQRLQAELDRRGAATAGDSTAAADPRMEAHMTARDGHSSLGAQLERRLSEAWQGLWDNFVDPREPLWDDGPGWMATGAAPTTAQWYKTPFVTELELRQIRDECRWLTSTNEFAINGLENRISYLVGAGHTYRAAPKKGRDVPAELWQNAQAVLDEFVDANGWHRRQQEIVRRHDRDGEVFLRFFASPDGQTRVRFVEPSQVSTPPERAADPAASFGIQTEPDDVETPLGYYIDGALVDACEIQHRKANVDANVKRGLPLFYPVRKNLRRAEKLLRNMSVVAEIQSAIALIRKHRGGTKTGVQQFVAGQTDATIVSPVTGQSTGFRRFGPGTILDSHGGIEYDFPAAGLDAANYVTILQAELRAIASRLVMPEFMLTSDASNANFASTMVAEGPALRMFARLQAELAADDLQVMRHVLANAVGAGRLPAEALEVVEVQVGPPSLEVRDALKEAEALRIGFSCGILSPQTWSQRLGLDYDQEQANWKQFAAHGAAPPQTSSDAARK